MLGALVLAPVILGFHIADSDQVKPLRDHPSLAAAGAVGAVVVLAVLALLFDRRPAWLPVAAAATLPFRVPIASGGSTANLLVPLYLVVAAGALPTRCRGWPGGDGRRGRPRRRGPARVVALSPSLALYGIQSSYSDDFGHALENVVFFYVPFALLFVARGARRVDAAAGARLPGRAGRARAGARGVGFVEYATRHLFLNPKVIASNQLEDYFRVNSLFFDPNIYGRFLAVVMLLLAAWLLWARAPARGRRRRAAARRAVGRPGADLLAVELHRAARRPRDPRGDALERALGAASCRAARSSSRWSSSLAPGRRPSRPRQLEVGRQGDERALRPHQGRPEAVRATRRWSARARARSRASTAAPSTCRPSARRRPRTRSR